MIKQLLIGGFALCLGMTTLLLGGCSQSHKPLNGVYYGYYDNQDANQFVILAFDKKHPDKVAIRQNIDSVKTNSVFSVKYSENAVTINTQKSPVRLQISKNDHTLTCPSCDGKSLPKTYLIGTNNGKVFAPKVAGIAFNTIAKDAKINDGYTP